MFSNSQHLHACIGTLNPIVEDAQFPAHREKRRRMSYNCEACDTSYTEKRSLIRHERTPAHCRRVGQPQQRYSCTMCAKTFARHDILERHKTEVHLNRRRHGSRASLFEDSQTITTPFSHDDYVGDVLQADVFDDSDEAVRAISLSSEGDSEISRTVSITDSAIDIPGEPIKPTTSVFKALAPLLESKLDQTNETVSIWSTSSSGSLRRRLDLPFHALRRRSSLVRAGGSSRTTGSKPLPPCSLCQQPWGDTQGEILAHLRGHFEEFWGEYVCDSCEIGFQHKADLQRHEQSALGGQCGFNFVHSEPCYGHHPPLKNMQTLTDRDRFQLCYRLRDWEQSQLKAYACSVEEVINELPPDPDCWSLGFFRRSVDSLASAMTGLDISSAPDRTDYQAGQEMKPSRLAIRSRLRNVVAYRLSAKAVFRMSSTEADFGQEEVASFVTTMSHGDLGETNELTSGGINVNGHSGLSVPSLLKHYDGTIKSTSVGFINAIYGYSPP